jgi:hypothetical protein
MPMKKLPGEYPRLEDFNRIYGPKQIQKLAEAHKRLGRQFRLGDHVQHVPGIGENDVRQWQLHMRSMPQLARTVLTETIQHSLTSTPPLPIKWIINRRSASGWAVAVTERSGRLVVEVTPPAPKAKPSAK